MLLKQIVQDAILLWLERGHEMLQCILLTTHFGHLIQFIWIVSSKFGNNLGLFLLSDEIIDLCLEEDFQLQLQSHGT